LVLLIEERQQMNLFAPDQAYRDIIAGLRGLSYRGSLIEEDYSFTDWFSSTKFEVKAAAFAQTPVSYESACIGVIRSNGVAGVAEIDKCRSLGAPVILEIGQSEVCEWVVSRHQGQHGLVNRHSFDRMVELFATRGADWKPESLLRAKNIGSFNWAPQMNLFAGLLPELEEQIQQNLDPLLRDALSRTRDAYRDSAGRDPDPSQIFKLVFWLLTAKVFRDRRVNGFANLATVPDPDLLLEAVARQYGEGVPRLLNRAAREVAVACIWANLDFRNLSVEILSQIWAITLVDDETKRRLGIHRTPRTIVRYIIDRIPFQQWGDDKRIILEPCCGSGVFLIGAMNKLRAQQKLFGATPGERHAYFVKHLAGIEKDPFGVEISRLALTLADFPNPGGWNIANEDVFDDGVLDKFLPKAGVVLCNPPFRDFDIKEERPRYRLSSALKPVELLNRVLDDLHPSGVLGFVLPRRVVDGRGYAGVRNRLVERFGSIHLTVLPDRAFEADPEVALLIATEPIPHHATQVSFSKVSDDVSAWRRFELANEVTFDHVAEIEPAQAKSSLGLPELPEVWDFLINFPSLEDVAELHRGIEWNLPLTKKGGGSETGNRARFVKKSREKGYWPGVPPRAKFNVFERPLTQFLSLKEKDARGHSYEHEWGKPKAIVNKSTRRRGNWRMAAFPDSEGLTCYQTFIAVWPKSPVYDELVLSAILNSPVANAFVATREGKTDITVEVLARVPVPHLTEEEANRIRDLIRRYRKTDMFSGGASPERLLMEIDAIVLSGYRMPPRLERQVLDFFRGANRPTPYTFGDYLPNELDSFFSLSDYLSPEFSSLTSATLLGRMAEFRKE
jgi:hypothetical protein